MLSVMAHLQENSNTSLSACLSLIKAHIFQFTLQVTPKFVSSPSWKLFGKKNRLKTFCGKCYSFHWSIEVALRLLTESKYKHHPADLWLNTDVKGENLTPSSYLKGLVKHFVTFFHLKNAFKGRKTFFQK